MTEPCKNEHGGHVALAAGWVCGQCWRIIGERPVKYGPPPNPPRPQTGTTVDALDRYLTRGEPPAPRGPLPPSVVRSQDIPRTPPQVIVWQADARVLGPPLYPVKVTIETFLMAVTRRFMAKAGMDQEGAFELALACMQTVDEDFGDPDFDWSDAGAADVVDEELSYWGDEEGSGKGNE